MIWNISIDVMDDHMAAFIYNGVYMMKRHSVLHEAEGDSDIGEANRESYLQNS